MRCPTLRVFCEGWALRVGLHEIWCISSSLALTWQASLFRYNLPVALDLSSNLPSRFTLSSGLRFGVAERPEWFEIHRREGALAWRFKRLKKSGITGP